MDTTWFAVDEDDQVAMFETGEGGSLPRPGFPCREPEDVLAAVLWALARSDERLREILPETLEEVVNAIDDLSSFAVTTQLLRSLGVWVYDGPVGSATPYVHEGGGMGPPLRVEVLDEELRQALKSARLPVRFRDAPVLAPGEHVPVSTWDSVWFDRQGRAHPSEGKEKAFAEMGELVQLEPDWESDGEGRAVLKGEHLYEALEDMFTKPNPWKWFRG